MFLCTRALTVEHALFVYTDVYTGEWLDGILKIETADGEGDREDHRRLTKTIRHIGLGGVPGFVLVHTPAGHTSYALERFPFSPGHSRRS